MYNPYSLQGKTILVTGASSGIGRATAIECARLGACLILTARNEERLKETKTMLDGEGHAFMVADITDEAALQELATEVPELDGVVFSAGTSMLKPVQAIKTSDLQQVFSTNCFAPMLLTKALIKKKHLKHGASLVFISSISGNTNVATGLSTYGASKAALSAYMKYAALELSGRGIRVNTILPGRIETELLKTSAMSEEETKKDIGRYPLKRYGKPQEVALSAAFLLSDAAQWITGTELLVDGGRSLI